jgi:hypothetical protein
METEARDVTHRFTWRGIAIDVLNRRMKGIQAPFNRLKTFLAKCYSGSKELDKNMY